MGTAPLWGWILGGSLLILHPPGQMGQYELIASLGQGAIIAVLWIENVVDPGLKVVGNMKPRTNADENSTVATNPFST
jgi:hypothetical protein